MLRCSISWHVGFIISVVRPSGTEHFDGIQFTLTPTINSHRIPPTRSIIEPEHFRKWISELLLRS